MSRQKEVRIKKERKKERKKATNNALMVSSIIWLNKLITSMRGRPVCEDALVLNEQQRH